MSVVMRIFLYLWVGEVAWMGGIQLAQNGFWRLGRRILRLVIGRRSVGAVTESDHRDVRIYGSYRECIRLLTFAVT